MGVGQWPQEERGWGRTAKLTKVILVGGAFPFSFSMALFSPATQHLWVLHNLFLWRLLDEVGLGLPQVLPGDYLLGFQDSKEEGRPPAG